MMTRTMRWKKKRNGKLKIAEKQREEKNHFNFVENMNEVDKESRWAVVDDFRWGMRDENVFPLILCKDRKTIV